MRIWNNLIDESNNSASQPRWIQRSKVDTIQGDATLVNIIESLQQSSHCWFAYKILRHFQCCHLAYSTDELKSTSPESSYKSLHGCAPDYLTELCIPVARSEPRSRLRSAAVGDLIIPRTTTSFSDRAFTHAGPQPWNSLPPLIRAAKTLPVFKKTVEDTSF